VALVDRIGSPLITKVGSLVLAISVTCIVAVDEIDALKPNDVDKIADTLPEAFTFGVNRTGTFSPLVQFELAPILIGSIGTGCPTSTQDIEQVELIDVLNVPIIDADIDATLLISGTSCGTRLDPSVQETVALVLIDAVNVSDGVAETEDVAPIAAVRVLGVVSAHETEALLPIPTTNVLAAVAVTFPVAPTDATNALAGVAVI
jgi:hypothetical protein